MSQLGITVIGDSIIRNRNNGKIYDWSNLLVKELRKKKINVLIKKKIIHGVNSRGVLNVIPDFLFKINKRFKNFILCQIGINDSWHYKSLKGSACVPKNKFRQNLEEIHKKFKIYEYKKIIFINYHMIDNKRIEGNGKTPNQNLSEYNNIIKKFCKKKKLMLIDVSKLLSKDRGIILRDKVHLNLKGTVLYSKIISKHILKIYEN